MLVAVTAIGRAAPVLVLLSLLPAMSVMAQSTADLQAAGQAAAAKYGVPWALFDNQIAGESSWNPNEGCSSANACGIAQFIPSTAAEYGVNVNDPVSSLNGAAAYDAALYQQTGSWSAALTKYTGGCTPASPCNAAYATAFQDAQTADAGGTTFPDGTSLTVDASATAPATPAAPSALSAPFSWAWNHIMQQAIGNVDQAVTNVETLVWGPAMALLALAIAVWGYRVMMGRE